MNTAPSPRPAAAPRSAQIITPRYLARAAQRRYTHGAAPPLLRGAMVPTPWQGFGSALRPREPQPARAEAPPRLRGWQRAAAKRRNALIALVLLAATVAATLLLQTQPLGRPEPARLAQVALFTLLFAWIAGGFFTAVMGFRVLGRGDPHALSYRRVAQRPVAAEARTALVMPICNEHVATVFAGLTATADSLVAAGAARLAEIYILSDTREPALRAAERAAWVALREHCAIAGLRVHYRWRLRRTRRKAGNVADFCRRWGRRHRYMVVLDADSVMSGEAVLGLVRLMEATPQAGIIQSAPVACGLPTLHARAQQFAARVSGRLFTAGMQYWQLGDSHYWGHNAIIRIAPFMAHCGLAPLPGRGGLAGDILSHDFVEAALMRRAGWQVWLVQDLPGSWEQAPPDLMAELQRDRRWCQGNLQNARLLAEPGLHAVHRGMLASAAMAYLSAPLWLAFVAVGIGIWIGGGHALFDPRHGVLAPGGALWAVTFAMLTGPRALGVWAVLREGRAPLFGGKAALVASALLEALLSMLTAPVRMVGHSVFVLGALTGLKLRWKSPPRAAEQLRWADAARPLVPLAGVVAAMAAAALLRDAQVALWLAPVVVPLLLALPLVVLGSRATPARRWGLFVTPEETATPRELRQAWGAAAAAANHPAAAPAQIRRLG